MKCLYCFYGNNHALLSVPGTPFFDELINIQIRKLDSAVSLQFWLEALQVKASSFGHI